MADRVAVLDAVLAEAELATFRKLKREFPDKIGIWMQNPRRYCCWVLSTVDGRERIRKVMHWADSLTTLPRLIKLEIGGTVHPTWGFAAESDPDAYPDCTAWRYFSERGDVEKAGKPWVKVAGGSG
jgi:hypothetical protein